MKRYIVYDELEYYYVVEEWRLIFIVVYSDVLFVLSVVCDYIMKIEKEGRKENIMF